MVKWDSWQGSSDIHLVMLTKHLLKWGTRKIDLHKIIAPDLSGRFHSHPANAIRVILWGSYVEEIEGGELKTWKAGMIGFVPGPYSHRFHEVYGPCYTLWIRGISQFKIRLVGYDKEGRDQAAASNQKVPDQRGRR